MTPKTPGMYSPVKGEGDAKATAFPARGGGNRQWFAKNSLRPERPVLVGPGPGVHAEKPRQYGEQSERTHQDQQAHAVMLR